MYDRLTIQDRLHEILESIELIQSWSRHVTNGQDFLLSPDKVMAFNACVMRLQVIGEQVGRLLKEEEHLLGNYPQIPWRAIYNLRNLISHEYSNIDEDLIFSIIHKELPLLKETVMDMERKL